MSVNERLLDAGYEDVLIFDNPDYGDAFIGVSEDNRAVYNFEKMVDYLIEHENMDHTEAVEWIEYNTVRSLPYYVQAAPIIVYPVP